MTLLARAVWFTMIPTSTIDRDRPQHARAGAAWLRFGCRRLATYLTERFLLLNMSRLQ